MNPAERQAEIRAWAVERRLPEVHLERWLGLTPDEQDALLELARALRLRTGQFVTVFEMLEEIGIRENQPIGKILERREIRRVFTANQSAPGKARALLDTLRAMRFPRLRAALDLITARVADLGLPAGARLVLPPNLSSDELRVELTAHSGAELKRLIDALAARSTELSRIADLLGGTDEV